MTKIPGPALDVFLGESGSWYCEDSEPSASEMEYSDPMEELKVSFRPLLSMVVIAPLLQTKQFVDTLCFKTLLDIHEFRHRSMMSTSIVTHGFDVLQDLKRLSMSRNASDNLIQMVLFATSELTLLFVRSICRRRFRLPGTHVQYNHSLSGSTACLMAKHNRLLLEIPQRTDLQATLCTPKKPTSKASEQLTSSVASNTNINTTIHHVYIYACIHTYIHYITLHCIALHYITLQNIT